MGMAVVHPTEPITAGLQTAGVGRGRVKTSERDRLVSCYWGMAG
jgi:hypothetical protein